MKLKFINLLLAAFLLIGSAQALTSCKDTDEDLYAQLRDDNLTLQKNLEAELTVLKNQISALETLTGGLQAQITALETKLGDYAKKSDLNDYVKKTEFNTMVDQYITAVSTYKNLKEVLDALKATQDEVTNAHGDFNSIGDRFVNIEGRLATLESTLQNYGALVSDVNTLKNFMTTATGDINTLKVDVAALQTSVGTLNTFMNEWKPKLGTIEQNAANALALAQKNEGDINALTQTYQQLQQLVLDNQTANEAAIAALQTKLGDLDTKLQGVLDDYMKKADVDQAISDAIAGLATQDALNTLAATLRQEAQDNMAALELRLQQQILNCITRINGLETKMSDVEADILSIQNDLVDIKGDIQTNKNNITILTQNLDNIIVRLLSLENRISGIVLQGTINPVFGYLNTPFGFESNVLMTWAGTADTDGEFPNLGIDGEEYDGELVLTNEDIAFLQACGIQGAFTYAAESLLMNEADGNLGTIYLTLNPANIDLEGKDFAIVNSQNKVLPVQLKNMRPSNKELTHGWSRVETSPNGFYEADVTVAAGDVPAVRVVIDQQLKAAAKKVLNDRSAASIVALGNALYNQFNGFLPALGIRAAWQETVGDENNATKTIEQSVYSQYGLAAATFNPLSYKFLYGRSFRQINLPDISAILDDYKFDFTGQGINITFDPITISGVDVNFHLNITPQIGSLGSIEIVIDNFPVDVDRENGTLITATKVIPVNLDDSDLASNINAALQDAFDGLDDEINGQLQGVVDNLIGQIQGQVNDMMAKLQVQVNTSLNDILANLQDQVNGKIDMIGDKITNNRFYTTLQNIINRFNGVLADPNHYLQPTLMYSLQGGASYGMFSQNKAIPTQFTGDGTAVMLTPTTYTGETVTPAFKKFVAVTNVFKSSDYSVNAQAGDAKCQTLAKNANAQKYMNEVVPGERRTMPFVFEGAEGYTFEIVYQALDYSGVTSTAKYYVSIK